MIEVIEAQRLVYSPTPSHVITCDLYRCILAAVAFATMACQFRVLRLLVAQRSGVKFLVPEILPTEIAAMRLVAATTSAVTKLTASVAHHSAFPFLLFDIVLAEIPFVEFGLLVICTVDGAPEFGFLLALLAYEA